MSLPDDLKPAAHAWTPAEIAALSTDEFDKHADEIQAQAPAMGRQKAAQRAAATGKWSPAVIAQLSDEQYAQHEDEIVAARIAARA